MKKAHIADNGEQYFLDLFPHQVTESVLFLSISLSAIQLIGSPLRMLLRALCLMSLSLVRIQLGKEELLRQLVPVCPERSLQRHGRWATATAKNIFVKDFSR